MRKEFTPSTGIPKHLRYIMDYQKFLTIDEEQMYLREAVKTDDPKQAKYYRDKIILSHSRLVMQHALKRARFVSKNITIEDMFQEGLLALHSAVDSYDSTRLNQHGKPVRFSTCAIFWIKQSIDTFIHKQSFSAYVPSTHPIRLITRHYHRIKTDLLNKHPHLQHNQDALITYLSKEMCVTRELMSNVSRLIELHPVELNETFRSGDSESTERINQLLDVDSLDIYDRIDDSIDNEVLLQHLHKVIDELNPRDKLILQNRLLKDHDEVTSLQELGDQLNISKERVRQIQVRAMDTVKRKLTSIRNDLVRNKLVNV